MKRKLAGITSLLVCVGGYFLVTSRNPAGFEPQGNPTRLVPTVKEGAASKSKMSDPIPRSTAVSVLPDANSKALQTIKEASRDTRRKQDDMKQAVIDDPHATPNVVIQAGRKIGEIAELELQHPEWKEEIQKFYLECAHDSEAITVTRVQCLAHYVDSRGLSATETQVLLRELPPAVQKLYGRFVAGN